MKQFKVSLAVIALVLGVVASSFTLKHANHAKTTTLYYYLTDGITLGTNIGSYDSGDSNRLTATGCQTSGTSICARGFDSPNPTSPSDPYSEELKKTP